MDASVSVKEMHEYIQFMEESKHRSEVNMYWECTSVIEQVSGKGSPGFNPQLYT